MLNQSRFCLLSRRKLCCAIIHEFGGQIWVVLQADLETIHVGCAGLSGAILDRAALFSPFAPGGLTITHSHDRRGTGPKFF